MHDGRCSLRLTRRYDATPGEVWAALTEPESLARWLARPRDLELVAGGAFELELPDQSRVVGRVRELEPERLLELDWRYADEDASIVRFELTSENGGTVLVLDHRSIDARFGMTYGSRWTRSLDRFAAEIGR